MDSSPRGNFSETEREGEAQQDLRRTMVCVVTQGGDTPVRTGRDQERGHITPQPRQPGTAKQATRHF